MVDLQRGARTPTWPYGRTPRWPHARNFSWPGQVSSDRSNLGLVPSPGASPIGGSTMRLIGREGERAAMDGLVAALRAGESRALVIHGQPGVGKTALLEYVASVASDCQVLSVAGMQSELELAFAGLHQLCSPLLDRLDLIPPLQREALQTTFGMSSGPTPDRFLVGLAVLSLLAEVARLSPTTAAPRNEPLMEEFCAAIRARLRKSNGYSARSAK